MVKKERKKERQTERKKERQRKEAIMSVIKLHTQKAKIVIWRQKIIWRQLNLEAQNIFTTQILSRQINIVETNLNVQNQRFPMNKT